MSTNKARPVWVVATAALLLLSLLSASKLTHAGTLMSNTMDHDSIGMLLPPMIGDWHAVEPPVPYLGKAIYDYMDGAGEIYRAYSFRELRVQRYSRANQPDILLEVFDMEVPRNAFGVFTYMLGRGPSVPVGQGGEYKSGLLTFWKGKFFVCVMIEDETEEAKNTLLDLGKVVAEAIRDTGRTPPLLGYLPSGEYLPTSLRYCLRHDMLKIHYSLSEDNCLLLADGAACVLVRMQEDRSYYLLAEYLDADQAEQAYRQFNARFLLEGKPREIATGKWRFCVRKGRYLSVVLDASTQSYAKRLQELMTRRLP